MAMVLVIDDEAHIRNFVRLMLEEEQYQVREAGNGAEGIARFREEHFDLVICDLIMPEQEGFETIGLLREMAPATPILCMSGGGKHCSPKQLLMMAKHLGAKSTVCKPFSGEEL